MVDWRTWPPFDQDFEIRLSAELVFSRVAILQQTHSPSGGHLVTTPSASQHWRADLRQRHHCFGFKVLFCALLSSSVVMEPGKVQTLPSVPCGWLNFTRQDQSTTEGYWIHNNYVFYPGLRQKNWIIPLACVPYMSTNTLAKRVLTASAIYPRSHSTLFLVAPVVLILAGS